MRSQRVFDTHWAKICPGYMSMQRKNNFSEYIQMSLSGTLSQRLGPLINKAIRSMELVHLIGDFNKSDFCNFLQKLLNDI